MTELELRRHAQRAKDEDALSPEGRVQAESVGRHLRPDYAFVFVSPAQRTAETVAWFLRATRQRLPPHAIVPGLQSGEEARWRAAAKAAGSSRIDLITPHDPHLVAEESERMAGTVAELFDRIPEGRCALAVGHSPLIEAALYGLTGVVIEPLAECEGVLLARDGEGFRVEELRLPV